jgi:hypothetical protein
MTIQSTNWFGTLSNEDVNPRDFLEEFFLRNKAVFVAGQLEKGIDGAAVISFCVNFSK